MPPNPLLTTLMTQTNSLKSKTQPKISNSQNPKSSKKNPPKSQKQATAAYGN